MQHLLLEVLYRPLVDRVVQVISVDQCYLPLNICIYYHSSLCVCVCVTENCTDYKVQFERVFSVPGDTAMLNSTLLSPDVFNFTNMSYNITWYNKKTGQEVFNQTGVILVRGEALWFLNVKLEDQGEYVSLLRYAAYTGSQKCHK